MKSFSLILNLLLLSIDWIRCEEKLAPIVKIPQGELQGSVEQSRGGQTYYGYWGIPFAKPPKRFQAPEPPAVPGWEGVRNATVPGAFCKQAGIFTTEVSGSEDCLFVNVYTSSEPGPDGAAQGDLKPVIAYIHGGGFSIGSGQFQGGDYLMDEPVVFVTLNYRMTALGFLNIGARDKGNDGSDYSRVANGNMGLKDQTLALRWIKDNIKAFGGDPARVTIFGTSAGAASVSYHIISPMSAGLFQNAIAASGSALNPWALSKNPEFFAKELGKALHCPTEEKEELIKCLLEKDANEITAKSDIKPVRTWPLDPFIVFRPTVEYRVEGQEVFLEEDPGTILQKGEFNKVPLLMGVTKDEGLFQAGKILVNDTLSQRLNDNWNTIAPLALDLTGQIPDANLDEASTDTRAFYLGAKCVSLNETEMKLVELLGDRHFVHGVRTDILLQAKSTPVYPYIFDFPDASNTFAKAIFGEKLEVDGRVIHGDDMKYGFSSTATSVGSPFMILNNSTEAQDFSKKYVKLLVSFASTGKPDASILGAAEWSAVTESQANQKEPLKWFHLNLAPTLEPETETFTGRMTFWDNLQKYA